MQREIKFRAWDKECETMVYSDGRTIDEYQCDYDFMVGNNGEIVCIWSEDYDDSCGFPSTHGGELDNLMQYTGLPKDKHGVDIYEGDIFKARNGVVAVVKWDEENGRFLGFTVESERKIVYVGQEPAVEVIGNIHQNHELLNIEVRK